MDHPEKTGDIDGCIVGPRMIAVNGGDEGKQKEQEECFARDHGQPGTGEADRLRVGKEYAILMTRFRTQDRSHRKKLGAIGALSVIRIRQKVLPLLRGYMQNSSPPTAICSLEGHTSRLTGRRAEDEKDAIFSSDRPAGKALPVALLSIEVLPSAGNPARRAGIVFRCCWAGADETG
jgi:hypothetical protein